MIKYLYISLLFFVLNNSNGFSQTIYWADTVLDYSSQYSEAAFGATQAIGIPNVPLKSNRNPLAWLSDEDTSAFIQIGFAAPISNINQIIICEAFYHNAVQKVEVLSNDQFITVYNQQAAHIKFGSQNSNYFFKKIATPITSIKVTLKAKSSIRLCGIDAIGVSESAKTISILPQISKDLAPSVLTKPLSTALNTPADESNPTLDIRGDKLLFTRTSYEGFPLLFEAYLDSLDQWISKAVTIDSSINFLHKYITAISPDGITALSIIDESGTDFQLSTLELADSNWVEQEQIIIPNVQLLEQKSDFFLSNSRKVMLMALTDNRTESVTNLYVSFKDDNNRWSEPKSLGTSINTLGKETSPFLSTDEKTLYFSSTGHQGFGGSDIFATKRLDDSWENWSTPENLGPTINSATDESDLCIPISGDIGFFSRVTENGDKDIYTVKLPILLPPEPVALVSGKVLNKTTQQPIHTKIIYTDLITQEEVGTVFSNATTGTYYITLPLGKEYSFLATSTGFMSQSEHIDLTDQKLEIQAIQDLHLVPLEETATLILKNIFYEHNSSYLQKSSYAELDRMVDLLSVEPSIKKVEITGYTDNQGSVNYNKWLSEKRAASVKNYLVKNGIAASRLTISGKGEENPIATNDSVEGKQKNRRVEFQITEIAPIN
ncbi:OmpA family protein [Flammeovirga kamogawensis]|uniref:OmpA family protein n=1 Tax=Flammeovirga kamogawensis TaxID=373891 RepID=A0ABX8GXX1_9BACT|nr:OmpA family protein [Flammeovirga kamogawensis]MBB6460799.1 outer membrane protein OmpA-like peptidoglycan-associated protein [Flammeovirga kamogawensis]QWG08151.1 OmpA family protein [Flammeovirga kamogawensis]TRX69954.1 OmpA family protein [Flammeovirga kamogawensis]